MRKPRSSPEAVIVVLLVLLAAAGIAFGGGAASSSDSASAGAEAARARVAPIARRVEAIRGLRFNRLPDPLIVSSSQARKDALSDVDRNKPSEVAQAGRVGELLGL